MSDGKIDKERSIEIRFRSNEVHDYIINTDISKLCGVLSTVLC